MKKMLFILPLILAVCLAACSRYDFTDEVTRWFESPTESQLEYDLNGVTGEASFTFYSESNNKILFTSGEALSGVEFTFIDGTVRAARADDGIEWELDPDTAEALSLFGKLYAYAASQSYNISPQSDADSDYITKAFEYLDGSGEVVFAKADAKPISLTYSQAGQTIKLKIKDIKILSQEEEK